MARYYSQFEYSGSRFHICSWSKTIVKNRMSTALGHDQCGATHRTGNFWHTSLSTQIHPRAKKESHHPDKQVLGCRKSIQDRKDPVQNCEQTREAHDWTWWISSTWCCHQLQNVQGQCPCVRKNFAGGYCNRSMWSDLVQWLSAYSAGAGGPGQSCPGVGMGLRWSQTGPWTSCVSTWCKPTPEYNEWCGWSTWTYLC